MLLEHNFRIFLLMGLICVPGIASSASRNAYCEKGASNEVCHSSHSVEPPVCRINAKTGESIGCGDTDKCITPIPGSEVTLTLTSKLSCVEGAEHCCCLAELFPCNTKEHMCQLDVVKNKPPCTPGTPPGTPTGPSPEPSKGTGGASTLASSIGRMFLLVSFCGSLLVSWA